MAKIESCGGMKLANACIHTSGPISVMYLLLMGYQYVRTRLIGSTDGFTYLFIIYFY